MRAQAAQPREARLSRDQPTAQPEAGNGSAECLRAGAVARMKKSYEDG